MTKPKPKLEPKPLTTAERHAQHIANGVDAKKAKIKSKEALKLEGKLIDVAAKCLLWIIICMGIVGSCYLRPRTQVPQAPPDFISTAQADIGIEGKAPVPTYKVRHLSEYNTGYALGQQLATTRSTDVKVYIIEIEQGAGFLRDYLAGQGIPYTLDVVCGFVRGYSNIQLQKEQIK